LQGNSHVSDLQLKICYLEEEEEEEQDGSESNDSIALLLKYMRESRALRKVTLFGRKHDTGTSLPIAILHRFFLAIAASHTIEDLFLDGLELHPEGFGVLIKTTQSLKSLRVQQTCGFASVAARDNFAQAVSENQTLEHLHLDQTFVEPVLLCLGSHPRLRELLLNFDDVMHPSQMEALAGFLRACKTLTLLDLCGYQFDKDLFETFKNGIRSSTSLTKLAFRLCEFDEESTLLFQHILEPKKDSTTIRELKFGPDNTFHKLSTGSVVVNILTPNQVGDDATDTGKITSLDLLDMTESDTTDLVLVCDALCANATGIRLQRFHVGSIDDTGCDALTRCLPQLLYLKQLSIESVASVVHGVNSRLLRALHQNGSLHDIHTGETVLQCSCMRNETIPILVAKPRLNDDENEDSDETDLCLVPTLFGAAKQAPRTAPTVMLIGLLATRDAVGPKSGGKRLCPDPTV
jgi:hypothetical protein